MPKLAPLLFLIFFLPSTQLRAQAVAAKGVNQLIDAVQKNTDNRPLEKIHLHLDKPWYSTGDTLWFKAYLFDAAYFSAASKSRLIYIDVADDSNHLVKRVLIPAQLGLSWGNLALAEKDFPAGEYTVKAYTKWMLNFGQESVFKRKFYVSDDGKKSWLLNLRKSVSKADGKEKAQVDLALKTAKNMAIPNRSLLLKVYDRGRVTDRDAITTGPGGEISVQFPLPNRSLQGKLALSLENQQKDEPRQKLVIPLLMDRPEFTDLQFMPESGTLLASVPARIAFKAIGEDGQGKDISGIIVNQSGAEQTTFKSAHKGMGYFTLNPVAGAKYSAIVTLPDGAKKTYPLPLVQQSGTAMALDNEFEKDSLTVKVSMSADLAGNASKYYLVAISRGIPCWGAGLNLNHPVTRLAINKNIFPSGVIRFTLLSADYIPLNERLTFVDRNDRLRISMQADNSVYRKRDSVALNFRVTDEEGKPVAASLSISITDDGQVNAGDKLHRSIVSDLLLCSELKGQVEEPGYYFQADSTGKIHADRESLLLTQGWTSYDWPALTRPEKSLKYAPEKEYVVQGRVTNMFNKPVKNTGVLLYSRNPVVIIDAKTNDSGAFVFANFPTSDTASFLLQARNKNGKSFNVGIEVDEFTPPLIPNPDEINIPWFLNIDTTQLKTLNRGLALKEEKSILTGKSQMLEEVFVIGKKVIKDSKNLNGPGESDFAMNAADLAKAGKATLRELLEKNISGFRLGGKNGQTWMVNSGIFHLIIDGITVDDFISEGTTMYEYYKTFFDYYTAEDIKGIELMKSGKYQMSYTSRYVRDPLAVFYDHVFVEVTTYSGHGPFMKKLPGIFLYKPLPLARPARFYTPHYTGNPAIDPKPGTDIRSTIHWEPNLVTDSNGKARISFFTADYPGAYTVVVEGADMDGQFGEMRQSIRVKD